MTSLLSALLILAGVAAPAHTISDNPVTTALRSVATSHGKAILAAARLMPADKYGYKPTPAQRSFGALVAHIVDDSHITCSAIAGVKPAAMTKVTESDSKETLVNALQSSMAFCDSAMAKVTDATLADSVTYYGDPGLRVQALVGIADDWADHYSQQAIYLRLNGILPPTAKKGTDSVATTGAMEFPAVATRNGEHDFDFEIGRWKIDMKRLEHPLSGSTSWISPKGYTHIVQKVWGGRASLAQLENDLPAPHYDGLMLRTYDSKTHQWNVYWASSKTGSVDSPLVGHFANGRGEFFNRDLLDGKPILVRVVYSDITPTSFRTEQDFSADDGKSWQANLMQMFTRLSARTGG